METQPFDIVATQTVDTIESWGKEKDLENEKTVKKAVTTKSDDDVIECECGILVGSSKCLPTAMLILLSIEGRRGRVL